MQQKAPEDGGLPVAEKVHECCRCVRARVLRWLCVGADVIAVDTHRACYGICHQRRPAYHIYHRPLTCDSKRHVCLDAERTASAIRRQRPRVRTEMSEQSRNLFVYYKR